MKNLIASALVFLLSQHVFAQTTAKPTNDWIHHSIFYEIFVRSFQDSNGDGIGDLNGVTSRLDYLQSLGVKGVWLLPIYTSPSYHGYDTIDYTQINPDYGTLDDFKNLLAEAHKRGLKIILDIALNHTSNLAPRFIEETKTAPAADDEMYLWFAKAVKPWFGLGKWYPVAPDRLYYSSFESAMPDVNWFNPAWRQEVNDVLHYWSSLGVDGFRLDAARYYVKGPHGETDTPETHQFIQDFVQQLKKDFPATMFVGEVWADANVIGPYVNSGKQLDLAFNFPLSFGLQNSLEKENAADFVSAAQADIKSVTSQDSLAPMVTNHDMIRIATDVKGNADKLKMAAAILLTLPGTPYIYYGEELGLPNGPGNDDRQKRTPMQWDDSANFGFSRGKPWFTFADPKFTNNVMSESSDANSVLETYRRWITYRNAELPLQLGDFKVLPASESHVAAYSRSLGGTSEILVLNFGATMVPSVKLDLPSTITAASTRTECPMNIHCAVVLKGDQTLTVAQMAPFSVTLVKLSTNTR